MCAFQIRAKCRIARHLRLRTSMRPISTAAHTKYSAVTGFAHEEWTKGIQKKTNMTAASYQVSRMLMRNVIPTTA